MKRLEYYTAYGGAPPKIFKEKLLTLLTGLLSG